MKTIFFILVMVITIGTANAVQPARKPFIKIKIDGNTVKTGDIVTISHGQKLKLEVEMEGGRRDFCKFPDSYADIAGTAQILSRGDNGLTYQLNDKQAEWKLLGETFQFTSDEFITINSDENKPTAGLTVSNDKFSQSFVKSVIKATWQFSDGESTKQEENIAETLIYFKISGSSDVWYLSQNIKASGVKDNTIQEKLIDVQSACDSIEKSLSLLKFPVAQQSIRNLQTTVSELKSTIDAVKAKTPAYQIKVTFTGLPSDKPYNDIGLLSAIKTSWASLDALLTEQKQALEKLPQQPSRESKSELVKLMLNYTAWQSKLPGKMTKVLTQYTPDIKADSIIIPEKLQLISKEKDIADYTQTLNDFNAFIDLRIKKSPAENQSINAVNSRIQAVRLFDGMLRSYFTSINWADWVNTRE